MVKRLMEGEDMGTVDSFCPVCGRRDSWGCGHSAAQRRAARRHNATRLHRSGACWHFDHADCDPSECRLAGNVGADGVPIHGAGFVPLVSHGVQADRWRSGNDA